MPETMPDATPEVPAFNRRRFCGVAAAVAAGPLVLGFSRRLNAMTDIAQAGDKPAATMGADKTALRPFHVDVPEVDLVDMRRRISSTKWPDAEMVADDSQGVRLATMQKLARYWATDYDWRKVE